MRIYSYHVFILSIVSLFFLGFLTSKFLLQGTGEIYRNFAHILERRDTEIFKRSYDAEKYSEFEVVEGDVSRDNTISGSSQPYLSPRGTLGKIIDQLSGKETENNDEDLEINEQTVKLLEEEDNEEGTGTSKRTYRYRKRSCQPTENIAFLKTHKTGSSTLTNILNRYADLRDLRVALPAIAKYRFGWPMQFHYKFMDILRTHGKSVHILSNHARYRRSAMDIVMRPGTKYISILRNPVTQFESTFHYMEFAKYLNLSWSKNPLQTFLDDPLTIISQTALKHESLSLIKNGMFFDLGLKYTYSDNTSYINRSIHKLNEDFELMLIMEYFDESLVLMMREFCWDFDDILYFKQNQRLEQKKPVSDYISFRIRAWNLADTLLYDFFNRTFWDRIGSHGEEFYQDLEEFRRLNDQLREDCVSKQIKVEKAFQLTGKIQTFVLNQHAPAVNRYFCEKMLRNEIDYIEYFRLKFNPYGSYFRQMEAEGRIKNESIDLYPKILKANKLERQRMLEYLKRTATTVMPTMKYEDHRTMQTYKPVPPLAGDRSNDRVRDITRQIVAKEKRVNNVKEIMVGDLVATRSRERKPRHFRLRLSQRF